MEAKKNDVLPGSNRAVLTLSDGRKVELVPETKKITEAGTHIQNENGKLVYQKTERVVMNTMSTPRGGQYQLTLPDGTNVWLNAASSITYPTAFINNTREVTITGEAYFEVVKNAAKPFIVNTYKDEITVLGTAFNVNAYTDEENMKTSLREGSVKIAEKILKPGQAYVNGKIIDANIEQDIGWKNGVFAFNDADLPTVMRQLSRWYNVDVVYAGPVPDGKFNGKIGRSLTLEQVLKGLTSTRIKYRIENQNKIIILP